MSDCLFGEAAHICGSKQATRWTRPKLRSATRFPSICRCQAAAGSQLCLENYPCEGWGTHPTHSDSAMSQSILQNYKFVTFAAFTPLQLTVTRFSRNVAVCRPICHAPSRWPYGQLKTPLTFAYLLDGLSAMSQALQLMAIVFFSFPNVCTWNRPEPSSKLLHVLVMYLCTGVFSFSKIIQRGKFVRIFI